jgi:hypothetical protein
MPFAGSPSDSPQRANEKDSAKKVDLRDSSGLRVKAARYVHSSGNGDGQVNMFKLPPGRIRIYPHLSRIVTSQMGGGAVVSVGYRAYKREDGTNVNASANEWANNLAAGSGAQDVAFTNGVVGTQNIYDSSDGIEVYATIASGNIRDNDTIYVACVYSGGEGN